MDENERGILKVTNITDTSEIEPTDDDTSQTTCEANIELGDITNLKIFPTSLTLPNILQTLVSETPNDVDGMVIVSIPNDDLKEIINAPVTEYVHDDMCAFLNEFGIKVINVKDYTLFIVPSDVGKMTFVSITSNVKR